MDEVKEGCVIELIMNFMPNLNSNPDIIVIKFKLVVIKNRVSFCVVEEVCVCVYERERERERERKNTSIQKTVY